MATLETTLELPITPEGCEVGDRDNEALLALFRELEFHSLLNQIATDQEMPKPDTNYQMITDEADLKHLLEKLKANVEFSVDLETTSTNPIDAQIVGIAITTAPHEGYYIPILSSLLEMPSLLSQDQVLEALRPVLEDVSYQKVGQNIKYDLKVFKRHATRLERYLVRHDARVHTVASGVIQPRFGRPRLYPSEPQNDSD